VAVVRGGRRRTRRTVPNVNFGQYTLEIGEEFIHLETVLA
jgi:hypothetical protein